MVYGDIEKDIDLRKKVVKLEFGIEESEFPERIVVTPLPIENIFLKDWKNEK